MPGTLSSLSHVLVANYFKFSLSITLSFPCLNLGVNGTIPQANQQIIGGVGVLTCNYEPTNLSYIRAEWRYKGPSDTGFARVYYYEPDGYNETDLHLSNRATHIHSSDQIMLIIKKVNETDDGQYRGRIIRSPTAIECEVNYTTISKYSIKYLD